MGEEITPQQALRQIPPTTIASVDSNCQHGWQHQPYSHPHDQMDLRSQAWIERRGVTGLKR